MTITTTAYVTLITTDSFAPGAKVLLHSLRTTMKPQTHKHKLLLLVTPQVSKATRTSLISHCDEIVEVEPIPNPYAESTHVQGWVDSGFTKLRVFGLSAYNRLVYVDADCLVLEDLEELFAIDKDIDFATAPDVFPPDRFNAGVLVIRPDNELMQELMEKAASRSLPSYDGGDTGFLNAYFPEWAAAPLVIPPPPPSSSSPASSPSSSSSIRLGRLPFGYNAQRTLHWMTHNKNPGYWTSISPLKILHFSSSPKPWEAEGVKKKGELEMKWWQAFVQMQMQEMTFPVGR